MNASVPLATGCVQVSEKDPVQSGVFWKFALSEKSAGMVVGGLVALLFVLDLALAIPFGRASMPADIGMMVSGGVLAYLGWNAFAETRRG